MKIKPKMNENYNNKTRSICLVFSTSSLVVVVVVVYRKLTFSEKNTKNALHLCRRSYTVRYFFLITRTNATLLSF